jgi:hypothetical protein
MSLMNISGDGRVGDMAYAKRVALSRAPRDASGFWIISSVQPGRGMSSVTYAHHDVGTSRVYQQYYTPGPLDALAFGPNSVQATPRSTYYVWTGLAFGLPDSYPVNVAAWDNPEDWSLEKLHQVVEAAVGPLPKGSTVDIWSPDGEGALYLMFDDEGVEDALSFAEHMNQLAASKPDTHSTGCKSVALDIPKSLLSYDDLSSEQQLAYNNRQGISPTDRQRIACALAAA